MKKKSTKPLPDPDSTILRILLESPDRFVTGNRLAEQLGMSRVAVWSHMKKLRRDGFVFEAVPNRGYRIESAPERLCLPYLLCLLPGSEFDGRVVYFACTDSTNQDAERLLAEGKAAPFVVVARRQTQGRGRLGRSWHSSDDGNLYTSFAFRPELPPERMQRFTLWMGVSLCRCIEDETGIKAGIKWPNDIWCGTKKTGGILTEAKVNSDQILEMVLGIGLNINSQPSRWPAPLCHEATSLSEAGSRRFDINRLTAAIVRRIYEAYVLFMQDNYGATLTALWENYDILRGREIDCRRGAEEISGRAVGIDEGGRLLVETRGEEGKVLALNAGDVTFKRTRSRAVSKP